MWRVAALVLALGVACDTSPAGPWALGRQFAGQAFGVGSFSPFYRFAAASPRYSRANKGFDPTPITFGRFNQGRASGSTIEAVEEVEEPVSGFTERIQKAQIDGAAVSFSDAAVAEPTADAGSTPSQADTGGSSTAEETKSSSASLEPVAESAPDSAGASILFPDQLASLQPKATDVYVPECDGVPFMALNNETGRCQFLMMRTECPEGQWFILDRDTLEASCRPLPCPEQEVLFDGACMPRDDAALCPEGMVVLINEYGDASCDCAVKHLYWPARDRCYPAFRRGPCHAGQYLTVGDEGVRCSRNACFRDGTALWRDNHCYQLRNQADSPCALGRLDVGVDTLELECVEAEPFAIFDLPVVRCSKGSKLDYGGRCKRELYQMFRSSFASSAARQSRCDQGFVAGASGRCLKAEEAAQR